MKWSDDPAMDIARILIASTFPFIAIGVIILAIVSTIVGGDKCNGN